MTAPSIAEVLATPEGRRALSAASPTYFDTYYCGMRAADHRTRWLDTFEDTIGEARKSGQKGRLLLLAPRDHGKTETLISAALRRVCLNRNIRILWISESAGTAKKRVGRLSKLLQSPAVKEDWEGSPEVGCGPFRQKDSEGKLPKWTETQIYVTRTLDSVDPTIEAVGCGGGITGGHFDLIFCHERGTPMLHEGQWIPVEQHPSFQGFKRDDGFEVRLFDVPGAEVVTPEHRYWATDTPWFDDGGWVEARNLTKDHYLGRPGGFGGRHKWSKVRSIKPVLDREFVPIKTLTSTYITAFGLSHNCDDLEDDRTTYSASQRQKTRAWWRGTVIPMLSRGGTMVVVGCLTYDTPVLMADGTWRPIVDVREGEFVWSIDEHGNSGPREVEATIDQGEAEVLRVQTTRHEVKATAWHPFLVARDGGLVWLRADELLVGDYLVTVKSIPGVCDKDWVTDEFCWLLGFLFGDGWVNSNKTMICAALGVDESLNSKVLALLEDWFPTVRFWDTGFGYVRGDNRPVARALAALGLSGKAETKRVPEWMFQAPPEMRLAFLRGMCAADGTALSRATDAQRVELCNEGLIEDLRKLAMTCGVRCGRVLYRERVSQPPNSPEPLLAKSWSISLNFAWVDRPESSPKVVSGSKEYRQRVASARVAGDGFRLDRVTAVTPAGRERVWDLTVQGTHSFIADGVAVHNTRKHHDDLYSHLKESPAWRVIEDKAILKWPERHEVLVKWDKAKQQDVIDRVEIEGEAGVLWEAERDIRYLLKERYNMTSMVFAREFQHDVLDDSAAAYKMAWFEDAKARGAQMRLGDIPVLDGRSLVISTGWDLALVDDAEKAQRQDSDFVAGMTVGRDPDTGDRYLLGIFHRRGMTPAAIQGAVKGQFTRFGGLGTGPDNPGVRAVVVERNAFGNLHYMGLQRSTDLPLKPHMTTGRNKADPWDGVASMGTQFENGKWIFPYHKDDKEGRALVDILVNELWGLGKEAHDDMAMALWIAELGLRGSTFVHRLAGADGVVEAGKGTGQRVEVLVSKKPPPDFQAQQLWSSLSGLLGDQGVVYDAEYTAFEDIRDE